MSNKELQILERIATLSADQQATFLAMATAAAAEMEKASAPTRQDQSTR